MQIITNYRKIVQGTIHRYSKGLFLMCMLFLSISAYGQEICNNGIDDDGDGLIDCNDGDCAPERVASGRRAYAPIGTNYYRPDDFIKSRNETFTSFGRAKGINGQTDKQRMLRVMDLNFKELKIVGFNYGVDSSSRILPYKIIEMNDGSIVISDTDLSNPSFIIKLKPDYTLDWKKNIVGSTHYSPIVKSPDNHIMLMASNDTDNSFSILKIDLAGNIVSNTKHNLPGTVYHYPSSPGFLPVTQNNLYYNSTTYLSYAANGDLLFNFTLLDGVNLKYKPALMRLNGDGTSIIFAKLMDRTAVAFEETCAGVHEGANGNLYAVNFLGSYWKFDANGNMLSTAYIATLGSSYGSVLNVAGNGVFLVNGAVSNVRFEPSIFVDWLYLYDGSIHDYNYPGTVLKVGQNYLSQPYTYGVGTDDPTDKGYYVNSYYSNGLVTNNDCTTQDWTADVYSITPVTTDIVTTPGVASVSLTPDPNHALYTNPVWASYLAGIDCGALRPVEVCNNGIDDDSDGLIDIADPDCACSLATCGKIPNVAYVFSSDAVDPNTNNNRGSVDLKSGGSCNCDLNPIAYNVTCNDNGTLNDASDDTYMISNFIVTSTGGSVGGYNLAGGITATGNVYGTAYSYGPFPISGGPLSVTATDVGKATCNRTDQIIPPMTCSTCSVVGLAAGGTVCTGEPILLTASGGDTYSWTGPSGFTSALQNPVINGATAAMAGTYTVIITNTAGGGCMDTKTASVTVTPLPTVSAGADQVICQESSATLVATGCSGTLLWSTGETTASISVNPVVDKVYTVSCTVAGCVGTDDVVVRMGGMSLTATPSVCIPATSTHSVSGSLIFNTPPTSGTLKVSAAGQQQIFNAPFVAPLTYMISGVPSTGVISVVSAIFSDLPMCEASMSYTSPASCNDCVFSAVSATAGPCNPLTNLYTLAGSLTFSDAPTTGTLTITSNGGGQTVLNAPFVSPIMFSFPGLVSDGAAHQVMAIFSDSPGCIGQAGYMAPIVCTPENDPCTLGITALPGLCNIVSNEYTVNGQLSFTNAPAGGKLVVFLAGGGQQEFFPPFTSPVSYSIPGLNSDGALHTIMAQFTENVACSATIAYSAPVKCSVDHCLLSFTANVGPCLPSSNTHIVSGKIYFNFPPTTGTLTVGAGGITQVFNAPFVSPLSYSLAGLPSKGVAEQIAVSFSADGACQATRNYQQPASCGLVGNCTLAITALAGPCGVDGYTLSGVISFTNPPLTGVLTISVDGISKSFNAPFTSPLNYSLTGMPANGSDHIIEAKFSNGAGCGEAVASFTAPANCKAGECSLNLTALASACVGATNEFGITGVITSVNAPASGTLTVSVSGTIISQVFNAPFSNSINYMLAGIPSDGLPHIVKAVFSNDVSCQAVRSIVSPVPCASSCVVKLSGTSVCTANSTYNISGNVLLSSSPSSGTLTLSSGFQSIVFNAPFDPVISYTFTGFTLGASVTLTAKLSASPGCEDDLIVASPANCNCNVALGSIVPLCESGTPKYNAKGAVSFENAPLSGTLTISIPGGTNKVFVAPFISPTLFEITGLTPSAVPVTMSADFSANASCSAMKSFGSPLDCPVCNLDALGLSSLLCHNGNTTNTAVDDYVSFSLNPTGMGLSAKYVISIVSGGGSVTPSVTNYGAPASFQFNVGSASQKYKIIRITDMENNGCFLDIKVDSPGTCSGCVNPPCVPINVIKN